MASKKNKGWGKIIGLLVILFIISWFLPKPIDWSISYKKEDKIPYGGYIIAKEIKQIFTKEIQISNKPVYNTIKALDSTQHYNYFLLGQSPSFSDLDLEKLLGFIEKGNNVFISATNFPKKLLDTINLSTEGFFWGILKKEQIVNRYWSFENEQISNYSDSIPAKKYGITYFRDKNYDDESFQDSQTLAMLDGNPTFIEIPFGKGKLFLHSHPLMFTNYFLLAEKSSEIASVCLSHLPNQTTIYDVYYQEKALESGTKLTLLQEIFNRPPLRWAYSLFFVSIFLFMFFHAKRTQRIIPILEPFQNESVGFAKTVGDLLFQNSDNKAIVTKKIKYFKQYLASKYHIHESKLSEEDILIIASKSGHSLDFIKQLIQKIEELNQKKVIQHVLLMEFTKELNKFYNRD